MESWLGWLLLPVGMVVPVEVHLDVEYDVPFLWPSSLRWRLWSGCSLGRGSGVGWQVGGCFSLSLLSSPAIWCLLFNCILSPPLFMCALLTAF